ncbi:MAG: glycosyltransferase [Clostridium sp.]
MRVLVIACYSPLINNSAAIETLQYLNNLVKYGNEVELLTVDFPVDCVYYDENVLSHMNKNIVIHKIRGGKIFDLIIPRKSKNSNEISKYNGNSSKTVLRKIKNAIVIPDMYFSWAKNAAKYGIELLKNKKYDVIISMHEPPSSHLCALYIKEKFSDIPWVTYWSDPWLKDSTREKAFILKRMIEKKMERKVVEKTNHFIFVTDRNRDNYIKEYNINKENTTILTRGYDKKLYENLKKEKTPSLIKKDKINIIYAGEIFSKLRDIKPFCKSLMELRDDEPEQFNKVNVLFFGNIDDIEGKNMLESLENVSVNNRISYNEATKYMLSSDVLIIFGNKNSRQIPAKIYDYMGATGRILTIYGDENDPIREVVQGHKKCINTLNNKEDIKDKLKELIKLYESNDLKCESDEKYECDNISNKLNKIINEV